MDGVMKIVWYDFEYPLPAELVKEVLINITIDACKRQSAGRIGCRLAKISNLASEI
jgi:hypothetical protein